MNVTDTPFDFTSLPETGGRQRANALSGAKLEADQSGRSRANALIGPKLEADPKIQQSALPKLLEKTEISSAKFEAAAVKANSSSTTQKTSQVFNKTIAPSSNDKVGNWIEQYKSNPKEAVKILANFSGEEIQALAKQADPKLLEGLLTSLLQNEAERADKDKLSGQQTFLRANTATSRLLVQYYEQQVPDASVKGFLKDIKGLVDGQSGKLAEITKKAKNERTEKDDAFLADFSKGMLKAVAKHFSSLPKEVAAIHKEMGESRALSAFFLRFLSPKVIQSTSNQKMAGLIGAQLQGLGNRTPSHLPKDANKAKQMTSDLDQLQKNLVK